MNVPFLQNACSGEVDSCPCEQCAHWRAQNNVGTDVATQFSAYAERLLELADDEQGRPRISSDAKEEIRALIRDVSQLVPSKKLDSLIHEATAAAAAEAGEAAAAAATKDNIVKSVTDVAAAFYLEISKRKTTEICAPGLVPDNWIIPGLPVTPATHPTASSSLLSASTGGSGGSVLSRKRERTAISPALAALRGDNIASVDAAAAASASSSDEEEGSSEEIYEEESGVIEPKKSLFAPTSIRIGPLMPTKIPKLTKKEKKSPISVSPSILALTQDEAVSKLGIEKVYICRRFKVAANTESPPVGLLSAEALAAGASQADFYELLMMTTTNESGNVMLRARKWPCRRVLALRSHLAGFSATYPDLFPENRIADMEENRSELLYKPAAFSARYGVPCEPVALYTLVCMHLDAIHNHLLRPIII